MTSNGRRQWRRWCRQQRRLFGGVWSDAAFIRRHPFREVAKPIGMKAVRPCPLPAKSFSPRSLVGMTIGARKRAAHAAIAKLTEHAWEEMLKVVWARYCIVQHLRPCPEARHGLDCVKNHCDVCEGTGVLPAFTSDEKIHRRRIARHRRSVNRAGQEMQAQRCTHPATEWIGNGRSCPGRDENGDCNGIPF